MNKQTKAAPKSAAVKTPTTKDVVKRVQGSTAADNGGEQKDWVRRLQSTADKRANAETAPPPPAPKGAAKAQGKPGQPAGENGRPSSATRSRPR
ncbi:hypothetical protein [Massilia phyllosphaerae]|uniref:hypothetical protein n=1 Tax=Massilia phyllosphaerae TaxID=3106034 RepID=UPI002B1CCC33|nr:hypothetical protein [Massilia sp. SGZ-792]